ncbi:Histone deacetylase hda1 [Thecaphora frezii]
MSFPHPHPNGSSQPLTQPSPILLDDNDQDEDIVFQGISHSPPQGFGTSMSLPPSQLISSSVHHNAATFHAAIHANIPAPPLPSISPALLQAPVRSTSFAAAPTAAVTATSDDAARLEAQSAATSSLSSRFSPPQDRYPTGLVYDVLMMLHANPVDSDHPEDPIRIHKIFGLLQKEGCVSRMKRIPTREVLRDEVRLVHEQGIWDGLERSAQYDRERLAEQTNYLERLDSLYVNEHSALAARLSCGGAIELCDAIASGRIHNGFAIIRPPGHHAEPARSMGFCFYNNVAVATRYLLQKYKDGERKIKKVLILDWDVHHGNGTQRAFEDDADVLYISLHRYDNGSFYPGGKYGSDDSVGSGPGEGRSVNIPWPCPGMGDGDYLYAFDQVVMPIARDFAPDFVIISAGFDAAEGDPIGHNNVTPTGYALMAHSLASLAEGRLAVILEGGYNPDAIAASALAVTKIILREPAPRPTQKSLKVSILAAQAVQRVAHIQSKYWSNVVTTSVHAADAAGDASVGKLRISDLLRSHRRYALHQRYDLDLVPIQQRIHHAEAGQALATPDILDNETVVFFAHDMGNLRADPVALNTTCERELGYIVDSSTKVLDWAHAKGYAILDVNVLQQLPDENIPAFKTTGKSVTAADKQFHQDVTQLLVYLFDNLISLSKVRNLVLIGHGMATHGILSLLDERRKVWAQTAAVVNVIGMHTIPEVSPKHSDSVALRKWYYKRSKVITSALHPVWNDEDGPTRRMGKVEASPEVKTIKVLDSSFPDIAAFIESKLRQHMARGADLDA